jgi:hypothetical protein
MDCRKIKKHLAQYIENDPNKEMPDIIKKHLASCDECRSEFASLKNYKKEIASLKKIKAPADFLQQLNARIEKKSIPSRITKLLFYPLIIKLPIEALGAAGIIFVFLFIVPGERINNNIQFVKSKSGYQKKTDTTADIRVAEAGKPTGKILRELNDQDNRQIPAIAARKSEIRWDETTETYEIALLLKREDKSIMLETDLEDTSRSAIPLKKSDVADLKDKENKMAELASGAAPDSDIALRQEKIISQPEKAKKSEKSAEVQTLSSNAAKTKAAGQNLSAAQTSSLNQIINFAESNKGKIISQELDEKGIQNVTIELPSGNKKQFLSGLNELGTVKKQSTNPEKKEKNRKVMFNIQIIQE